MSIDVKLHHRTSYQYDQAVKFDPHAIRLRPAPHTATTVLSYGCHIEPKDHWIHWRQDPFSNYVGRIVCPNPSQILEVTIELIVRLEAQNPFTNPDSASEMFPIAYRDDELRDLTPYLRLSQDLGPLFKEWSRGIDRSPRTAYEFLSSVISPLHESLRYLVRMEPGVQTPEETLENRSGSCRDYAWLTVNLLRSLGVAARFVSGYSIQLKPDVPALEGGQGVEADVCDLHAWAEAYLPRTGWVGLDATAGLFTSEGHIPLACTPEPGSAAPISGSFSGPKGVKDHFEFEMSVQRIQETPRVTLPYSDNEWRRIESLGHEIDRRLRDSGCHLTMGGEPTFVSIDDYSSPQWTTAALGAHKKERAEDLLRRLFNHYAKGGFLHYGQGKWYPGEQLPRWAYAAGWRKDGDPLWNDPKLLADVSRDYGHTVDDARRFSATLCGKLGVHPKYAQIAHEDVYYYLWKERRLPGNVDPFENRIDDEVERDRIARIFTQGLDHPVGYALPLARGWVDQEYRWVSGPWFLRTPHLYLLPGDSPMGYRLPLDSLPWLHEEDREFVQENPAPVTPPPLPSFQAYRGLYSGEAASTTEGANKSFWGRYFERFPRDAASASDESAPWAPGHMRPRPTLLRSADTNPEAQESADWVVRTTLCVEPREGRLHVFLPPLYSLEDFADLLVAIELTAEEESLPIVLEGYPAPRDPRLETLQITPDPGVIEVNIHPSHSWEELVERTHTVYECARLARLSAEKFDIDGGHTGTGGGNHIVLGAPTPEQSPFLRKPRLLASLIAYWHNHPSLSYLFSGKFIGPTSQAPRIDEARDDNLYEMEIAFRELENQLNQGSCTPWLVDRIFRNLLVDITGNTHRAEFCIDKLFSPDGFAGRLGLLEQRAFEMPPHARMSLTQALLIRAILAKFWEEPFIPERLNRWGPSLHDRFMLPEYVAADFQDVLDDLNRWGFPFERDWFAPHFEFRFPSFGSVSYSGVTLEAREAIEPWHVLGEENASGGTARYVDSSVERIQIKATGLHPQLHAIVCNGFEAPLSPTSIQGVYVAGIRYRAWSPPSALHPTLPTNNPIKIDLIDRRSGRSLGGLQYHVTDPAGRGHDDFPVNSLAAESRRLARFQPHSAQPGTHTLPYYSLSAQDFPTTLDLRRPATLPTLLSPTSISDGAATDDAGLASPLETVAPPIEENLGGAPQPQPQPSVQGGSVPTPAAQDSDLVATRPQSPPKGEYDSPTLDNQHPISQNSAVSTTSPVTAELQNRSVASDPGARQADSEFLRNPTAPFIQTAQPTPGSSNQLAVQSQLEEISSLAESLRHQLPAVHAASPNAPAWMHVARIGFERLLHVIQKLLKALEQWT